ncbi:hypothetical protein Aph01nite_61460 [Acrocarpospora phusangensis]|uniref:Butirosin biosynthesis protein H N-terminal domain-containing protein n=1 Tax=Acrocarpospora phusangensis TaxID=1070424 RepID=A0A919QFD6_9ACTN|nr:BtrH N-terminal domain-containing protein [Acrocarpospora phusangensis]GIH27836.1 hypothetical protein Aph01nite_61460 [Acrocarpospora phusangensis]
MRTRRSIDQWYRDPVSCLQSTVAALLLADGQDPLEVLGLAWEFRYLPGDVRPEEFYWPCRVPGDPVASLLPYHPARSRWRTTAVADPLAELREALAEGRLPVVAVDNYHLPFRPALNDVHSAHLIVVYDIDQDGGTVLVSDAMPPAYDGELPVADLLRAWTSANPREQEAFFSGAEIQGRWLDVSLGGPYPALGPERLAEALRADAAGFDDSAACHSGLAGLKRFAGALVEAAEAGNARLVEEAYTFGWGMQAQAALHGELLRRCGNAWRVPSLAEAGRRVERTAHLWTPVRVTAAHGRGAPRDCARDLRHHTERLEAGYRAALIAIDDAVAEL